MSPVKIAVAGCLVAATLIAGLLLSMAGDRQPAFAYRFTEGQRLRYALSWSVQQTTRLPQAQRDGRATELGGRTDMALDLVLDTVSVQPGRAQLLARFDDL